MILRCSSSQKRKTSVFFGGGRGGGAVLFTTLCKLRYNNIFELLNQIEFLTWPMHELCTLHYSCVCNRISILAFQYLSSFLHIELNM